MAVLELDELVKRSEAAINNSHQLIAETDRLLRELTWWADRLKRNKLEFRAVADDAFQRRFSN